MVQGVKREDAVNINQWMWMNVEDESASEIKRSFKRQTNTFGSDKGEPNPWHIGNIFKENENENDLQDRRSNTSVVNGIWRRIVKLNETKKKKNKENSSHEGH